MNGDARYLGYFFFTHRLVLISRFAGSVDRGFVADHRPKILGLLEQRVALEIISQQRIGVASVSWG